jgi:hypothetical protein
MRVAGYGKGVSLKIQKNNPLCWPLVMLFFVLCVCNKAISRG